MEHADIFRKNVLSIIEDRGLKQKHIAGAIGESPQKLNDYLKGRIGWGEVKRGKLARFLKVPYADFYIDSTVNPTDSCVIREEICEYNNVRQIEARHAKLVSSFKNKALALEINQKLLLVEKHAPDNLEFFNRLLSNYLEDIDLNKKTRKKQMPGGKKRAGLKP